MTIDKDTQYPLYNFITNHDRTMAFAGEQFCGLDVNTPLGGELPITAAPVKISFSRKITATFLFPEYHFYFLSKSLSLLFLLQSEGHYQHTAFSKLV